MPTYRYPQESGIHKVEHNVREDRALIFPPYRRDSKWAELPDILREKGFSVRPWTVYAPSGRHATWSVKGFGDISQVLDALREFGFGEPSHTEGMQATRIREQRENGEEHSR